MTTLSMNFAPTSLEPPCAFNANEKIYMSHGQRFLRRIGVQPSDAYLTSLGISQSSITPKISDTLAPRITSPTKFCHHQSVPHNTPLSPSQRVASFSQIEDRPTSPFRTTTPSPPATSDNDGENNQLEEQPQLTRATPTKITTAHANNTTLPPSQLVSPSVSRLPNVAFKGTSAIRAVSHTHPPQHQPQQHQPSRPHPPQQPPQNQPSAQLQNGQASHQRGDQYPPPYPKPSVLDIRSSPSPRRSPSPQPTLTSRSILAQFSVPDTEHDRVAVVSVQREHERQLAEQDRIISELRKENQALRDEIHQGDRAEEELIQRQQNEIRELHRIALDAQEQMQTVETASSAKVAEVGQLRDMVLQLQQERDEVKLELAEAKSEVEETRLQLSHVMSEAHASSHTILMLQKSMQSQDTHMLSVKLEMEEHVTRLSKRLDDSAQQWMIRESQLLAQIQHIVAQARDEHDVLKQQIQNLEEQLSREQQHSSAELAASFHNVNSLQQEMKALEQARAIAIEALRREKEDELQATIESKELEYADMAAQLNTNIAQKDLMVADIMAKFDASEKKGRELEDEIRQRIVEAQLAHNYAKESRDLIAKLAKERELLQSSLRAKDLETAAAIDALNNSLHAQVNNKQNQLEEEISRATELEAQVIAMQREMDTFENIRRKMHNMIQELKGNIRVFCRVRPPLIKFGEVQPGEIPFRFYSSRTSEGQERLEVVMPPDMGGRRTKLTGREAPRVIPFVFDRVFRGSDQHEVFEEIAQLVQSVLDGYRVCIFAYGQTGSGKTYTMEGDGDVSLRLRGIVPRTVEKIFECTAALQQKHGWKFRVVCSFLEIYNEELRDLLSESPIAKGDDKIQIKHMDGRTTVSGITVMEVTQASEVILLLERAKAARVIGETRMNDRSSRSHSVFRLEIEGECIKNGDSTYGILNLIDLAGSERLSQSEATGQRLKEVQHINKSLHALADVITSLANKESHVPYRNSKLTFLLQESLGGDSKMLMFSNVSSEPQFVGESLCTLRFADKVNHTHIGTASKTSKVNLVKVLEQDCDDVLDNNSDDDNDNDNSSMNSGTATPTFTTTPSIASAPPTTGGGLLGVSNASSSSGIGTGFGASSGFNNNASNFNNSNSGIFSSSMLLSLSSSAMTPLSASLLSTSSSPVSSPTTSDSQVSVPLGTSSTTANSRKSIVNKTGMASSTPRFK